MSLDSEFILKIEKNEPLLEEIFKFDPRNLETTESVTLSKYTIALAQYVIYLNSRINRKKMSLLQKKRILDLAINESDIKAKTKAEKRTAVINNDVTLNTIESGIHTIEDELTLLDGSINYFIELINAFKRELTRREKELEYTRYERRC